jgi:peptidoglycan/LPS O-acetylase OafA/YrhL
MLAFENKTKISSPHIHFENLDGLRFLAALMVFFHHLFSLDFDKFEHLKDNHLFIIIQKVCNFGHYGVGVFFIISGFLIFSLLLHEYKKNQKISWSNFFMRRILRIWPLYFLVVIFGFFIFPYLPFGKTTIHHFSNYALFLSNFDEIWYGAKDAVNFLTVTWSISVEEQIYYGTILLFLFLPSKFFYKYGIYIFSLLILISIGFKFVHNDQERLVYFHTLTNMIYLAIGALLAFLNKNDKVKLWVQQFTKNQVFGLYTLSFIMIGVMILFKKEWVLISDLLIGIAFSIWMILQVFSQTPFIALDRFLGFKQGGKITYGFYLFHTIVLYYLASTMQFLGFNKGGLSFLLFAILSFFITYLLAKLSFHYFENPFLKMKNAFRQKQK